MIIRVELHRQPLEAESSQILLNITLLSHQYKIIVLILKLSSHSGCNIFHVMIISLLRFCLTNCEVIFILAILILLLKEVVSK